jgi:Cdc6-like AAA superfamily ATPase
VDIDDYLTRRMEALRSGTSVLRDPRVFDFSHVPDQPLLREEARPIIDSLLRYASTGIPQNLVILGSRGCGKTLLLKFLQRQLKERVNLDVLYGNCRTQNTTFKLLAEILRLPLRGAALQELYRRFEERHPRPTVVVLDEVDLISKKDPNKDILYFLSRSDRGYMVVCLSNNPRLLSELDASVRSSLQAEVLYLRNYDAVQVAEILALRAAAGLRSWREEDLARIASLTVQRTNSDVRVAIKTLYYAVTGEDRELEASFDRAQHDITIDVVSDLNSRNLLILRAVQLTRERFVKKVFTTYEQISRQVGETSFSYVYFLNNLSYMQSLGLVILVQTKVNRSYTNTVSLLFNDSVLDTIYRLRFA